MTSNKRGTETRAMTKSVLLRLDETSHDALVRAAEASGETAAAFVRALVTRQLGTPPTGNVTRRRVRLDPHHAVLLRVASTLGIIEGLLTQLAAVLRRAGIHDWHRRAEAALTDIRACRTAILTVVEETRS